jgi:hypothetical protein
LELRNQAANSWGAQVGVQIEAKRKMKEATLRGPGGTYSSAFTDPKPTIQSEVIYENAVYQWNHFYIPFGLNFSIVDLDMKNISAGEGWQLQNGPGAQVGIGYQFTDYLSLELQEWATSYYFMIYDSTQSIDIDFNQGVTTDTRLMLKLGF